MPWHQANLSEKHAQTGINVCTPERLPLVEVGGGGIVWCVCIPIGNLRRYLAHTDYKQFAGWRSLPGLTAVRFPPTEFKLF